LLALQDICQSLNLEQKIFNKLSNHLLKYDVIRFVHKIKLNTKLMVCTNQNGINYADLCVKWQLFVAQLQTLNFNNYLILDIISKIPNNIKNYKDLLLTIES